MASLIISSIEQYLSPDKKEKGVLDHGETPVSDTDWQRATVVFLKINFAIRILAIPAALGALGSVGGSLYIIGYTSLNVYTGLFLGDVKHNYTECHTLADMMGLIWGRWGREIVGI
ncbi:uncharacterized protein BKA55DRAFT_743926 [Fusarium redolens]|uniref:Uncharacterized protein n=1 Tax=Fusarium redolens TaxID=48865 RepID=A0A9P9FWQ6_FUSRE|nr:uncharacterized protein BKA55DRAFT_743926 [Fusarium redolens]KAH7220429.1 hypothetical protein BKA55DRAFT_743926 [Fusarium redolens]